MSAARRRLASDLSTSSQDHAFGNLQTPPRATQRSSLSAALPLPQSSDRLADRNHHILLPSSQPNTVAKLDSAAWAHDSAVAGVSHQTGSHGVSAWHYPDSRHSSHPSAASRSSRASLEGPPSTLTYRSSLPSAHTPISSVPSAAESHGADTSRRPTTTTGTSTPSAPSAARRLIFSPAPVGPTVHQSRSGVSHEQSGPSRRAPIMEASRIHTSRDGGVGDNAVHVDQSGLRAEVAQRHSVGVRVHQESATGSTATAEAAVPSLLAGASAAHGEEAQSGSAHVPDVRGNMGHAMGGKNDEDEDEEEDSVLSSSLDTDLSSDSSLECSADTPTDAHDTSTHSHGTDTSAVQQMKEGSPLRSQAQSGAGDSSGDGGCDDSIMSAASSVAVIDKSVEPLLRKILAGPTPPRPSPMAARQTGKPPVESSAATGELRPLASVASAPTTVVSSQTMSLTTDVAVNAGRAPERGLEESKQSEGEEQEEDDDEGDEVADVIAPPTALRRIMTKHQSLSARLSCPPSPQSPAALPTEPEASSDSAPLMDIDATDASPATAVVPPPAAAALPQPLAPVPAVAQTTNDATLSAERETTSLAPEMAVPKSRPSSPVTAPAFAVPLEALDGSPCVEVDRGVHLAKVRDPVARHLRFFDDETDEVDSDADQSDSETQPPLPSQPAELEMEVSKERTVGFNAPWMQPPSSRSTAFSHPTAAMSSNVVPIAASTDSAEMDSQSSSAGSDSEHVRAELFPVDQKSESASRDRTSKTLAQAIAPRVVPARLSGCSPESMRSADSPYSYQAAATTESSSTPTAHPGAPTYHEMARHLLQGVDSIKRSKLPLVDRTSSFSPDGTQARVVPARVAPLSAESMESVSPTPVVPRNYTSPTSSLQLGQPSVNSTPSVEPTATVHAAASDVVSLKQPSPECPTKPSGGEEAAAGQAAGAAMEELLNASMTAAEAAAAAVETNRSQYKSLLQQSLDAEAAALAGIDDEDGLNGVDADDSEASSDDDDESISSDGSSSNSGSSSKSEGASSDGSSSGSGSSSDSNYDQDDSHAAPQRQPVSNLPQAQGTPERASPALHDSFDAELSPMRLSAHRVPTNSHRSSVEVDVANLAELAMVDDAPSFMLLDQSTSFSFTPPRKWGLGSAGPGGLFDLEEEDGTASRDVTPQDRSEQADSPVAEDFGDSLKLNVPKLPRQHRNASGNAALEASKAAPVPSASTPAPPSVRTVTSPAVSRTPGSGGGETPNQSAMFVSPTSSTEGSPAHVDPVVDRTRTTPTASMQRDGSTNTRGSDDVVAVTSTRSSNDAAEQMSGLASASRNPTAPLQQRRRSADRAPLATLSQSQLNVSSSTERGVHQPAVRCTGADPAEHMADEAPLSPPPPPPPSSEPPQAFSASPPAPPQQQPLAIRVENKENLPFVVPNSPPAVSPTTPPPVQAQRAIALSPATDRRRTAGRTTILSTPPRSTAMDAVQATPERRTPIRAATPPRHPGQTVVEVLKASGTPIKASVPKPRRKRRGSRSPSPSQSPRQRGSRAATPPRAPRSNPASPAANAQRRQTAGSRASSQPPNSPGMKQLTTTYQIPLTPSPHRRSTRQTTPAMPPLSDSRHHMLAPAAPLYTMAAAAAPIDSPAGTTRPRTSRGRSMSGGSPAPPASPSSVRSSTDERIGIHLSELEEGLMAERAARTSAASSQSNPVRIYVDPPHGLTPLATSKALAAPLTTQDVDSPRVKTPQTRRPLTDVRSPYQGRKTGERQRGRTQRSPVAVLPDFTPSPSMMRSTAGTAHATPPSRSRRPPADDLAWQSMPPNHAGLRDSMKMALGTRRT